MKKLFLIVLVLVMTMSFAVVSYADDAPVTFRFLQGQPEFQVGAAKLVEAYEAEHPNVTIELITDISTLQTDLNTGNIPEIFYTEGYSQLKVYQDYLEDLSDQPWVAELNKDADAAVFLDGKCLGWPTTYCAVGIVYNKAMFAEHGWQVPQTFDELEALCEQIQSEGIQPFINEWADDWSIGHMTFAGGITYIPDVEDVIAKAYEGQAKWSEQDQMKFLQKYVDLMAKYGGSDPMSNSWNEFCIGITTGEAAMGFEGDFIWTTVEAIDPDLDLGLFALPAEKAEDTAMCMSYNMIFHIGKGSKEPEAAKDFLNWMSTSEVAKEIILNDYQFTTAFNWEFTGTNKLLFDSMKYKAEGKITPWYWNMCPTNFRALTGSEIQKYIAGETTWDDVLAQIDARWSELMQN